MEASDIASEARESGSDSEWAIVDEATSLQEANGDSQYVFRGDLLPEPAADRATGEVSDGESIEIVPDDRDVEALEAANEVQELHQQPLNLERVEQVPPVDESTVVGSVSRDVPVTGIPHIDGRDHWDFVAILLVALVGGFAVGFYCGSAGVIPGQPIPVSADLVQNLRSEIRVLRSAFQALQSAAIAAADAPLPLAAPVDGSSPTEPPLVDVARLYAEFSSFRCRWQNECVHGDAFCPARNGQDDGNDADSGFGSEGEGRDPDDDMTLASLEDSPLGRPSEEGTPSEVVFSAGNHEEMPPIEILGKVDVYELESLPFEEHRGSELAAFNDGGLSLEENGWGLTLECVDGTIPNCDDDMGLPCDNQPANLEEAAVVKDDPANGLAGKPVATPEGFSEYAGPQKADAVSKLSEMWDSSEMRKHQNLGTASSEAPLEALTRLAALLVPDADLTTLTQALNWSAHSEAGADGSDEESTAFASLAERRVVKLAARLESVRRRAAHKATRAIARADAELHAARDKICTKTAGGPLCPVMKRGQTSGPQQSQKPGPKEGPEQAGSEAKTLKASADRGKSDKLSTRDAKREGAAEGKAWQDSVKPESRKREKTGERSATQGLVAERKGWGQSEGGKAKGETRRKEAAEDTRGKERRGKKEAVKEIAEEEGKKHRDGKEGKKEAVKKMAEEEGKKHGDGKEGKKEAVKKMAKEEGKKHGDGKEGKKEAAKKMVEEEGKEQKSKERQKTEDFERHRHGVKELKKKEKTDGKKSDAKGESKRGETGERKEDRKRKEEEGKTKVEERKSKDGKRKSKEDKKSKVEEKKSKDGKRKNKEEDRKSKDGKRGDHSEPRDWSDRRRAAKPKGDSGPRRAFDWPTPAAQCHSLPSDWSLKHGACESQPSPWSSSESCESSASDWPAQNVSWVIARGQGREASRSSHAKSDWLFDRAAARKHRRDWSEFEDRASPESDAFLHSAVPEKVIPKSTGYGVPGKESGFPERQKSKFGKRWISDKLKAAGRKVREAFDGMKQRAHRWR